MKYPHKLCALLLLVAYTGSYLHAHPQNHDSSLLSTTAVPVKKKAGVLECIIRWIRCLFLSCPDKDVTNDNSRVAPTTTPLMTTSGESTTTIVSTTQTQLEVTNTTTVALTTKPDLSGLSNKQIYYINQLSNPWMATGDDTGQLNGTKLFGFEDQTTKILIPYNKENHIVYMKSNNLYSAKITDKSNTTSHQHISGPWDGSVSNDMQYSIKHKYLFINTGSDLWRWDTQGSPENATHLRGNGDDIIFAYCENNNTVLVVDVDSAFSMTGNDTKLKNTTSTFTETDSNYFVNLGCSDNYVWAIDENNDLFRSNGFNEAIEVDPVGTGFSSLSICDDSDIVVLQRANAETTSMYVSGKGKPEWVRDTDSANLATKSISCK